MNEILLKVAGFLLLMICIANAFAFKKLGWNKNLANTENFFQQIFKVHTLYIVMTMVAMALACLYATTELVKAETLMARGFLWFGTIFWGGRVLLHFFYYDQQIKKENPRWNALFLATFTYIAGTFLYVTLT